MTINNPRLDITTTKIFNLGSDLSVNRLGYGAMRLTTTISHLEENIAAASITLTTDDLKLLGEAQAF